MVKILVETLRVASPKNNSLEINTAQYLTLVKFSNYMGYTSFFAQSRDNRIGLDIGSVIRVKIKFKSTVKSFKSKLEPILR